MFIVTAVNRSAYMPVLVTDAGPAGGRDVDSGRRTWKPGRYAYPGCRITGGGGHQSCGFLCAHRYRLLNMALHELPVTRPPYLYITPQAGISHSLHIVLEDNTLDSAPFRW